MLDIRNCDCMDLLKEYPDKHFELAIVDPPYGISADSMTMGQGSGNDVGKFKAKGWDNNIPKNNYFVELKRVSRHQIIWGGNYFPLGISRCYLIWDKIDYNSDFASAELAWTSFDSVVKTFHHPRNTKTKRIHPTQKPVALYEWLLTKYAKKGDKILDTHGGSMSIAIAAWNLGFDLTLCELDKDYFEAGKKRVEWHMKQKRLLL